MRILLILSFAFFFIYLIFECAERNAKVLNQHTAKITALAMTRSVPESITKNRMNISTLIQELSALQEKYGDLPVNVTDCEGYDAAIDRIDLTYPRLSGTYRNDTSKGPDAILLQW